MPEATETAEDESADEEPSKIESDLHPKHQQVLMDVYDKADWLVEAFDDNQFIQVPSRIRSIRNSLQGVLTEQGLLEHLFLCTYCGLEVWESEKPRTTKKECPECDARLEHANTRSASANSE